MNDLSKRLAAAPDDIYYDAEFRTTVESHLEHLRRNGFVDQIPISPDDVHAYRGNLKALFNAYSITEELHWVIMRLNGFTCPTATLPLVNGTATLDVIDLGTMNNIITTHSALKK